MSYFFLKFVISFSWILYSSSIFCNLQSPQFIIIILSQVKLKLSISYVVIPSWFWGPCWNYSAGKITNGPVNMSLKSYLHRTQWLRVQLEWTPTVWGGAGGHRLLADVIARRWALGRNNGLHPLLLLSCWTGLGMGFHGDCSFLNTSWRWDNWWSRSRRWRGRVSATNQRHKRRWIRSRRKFGNCLCFQTLGQSY